MKHRQNTYTNKPLPIQKETQQWTVRIIIFILVLLILNNLWLRAEGTTSIAPSTDDETALFIGAGNTGSTGGNYGEFAWKGSSSRLSFNIQSTCEKVYIGFSSPKRDRRFRASDIDQTLIFRIIDPQGNPINDLSCFGNKMINGEAWQTLRTTDVNLISRAMVDLGPANFNVGGYTPFELDLSACNLTLTGDYSIEFYTERLSYDPNRSNSGFYIEYFDVTVANCNNEPVNGRLWSNNWGFAVKRDGDGPFDRAFNGAFYICSKEGFITKINFNTGTNNRAEAGKNNDQRSGFRAGAFNVSLNTMGPNRTGNIQFDRQSVWSANSTNPELPVFLNLPDPAFCPPQAIGEFKAKKKFLSGCPGDYCINVAFSKPGQVELLIEASNGNRKFDNPTEVRFVREVTESDRVAAPEDVNFPYELCIPWSGKDGNGNFVEFSKIFISGFYFQGIYHFPVYDAEFNDDGFTVETVRPALGMQELFYDDRLILADNLTGESQDGTNGCESPCHRWTGEYLASADQTQIFGNFNTINTWWFANSTFKDFSLQPGFRPAIVCPPDYVGCPEDDISPNVIGNANVSTSNPECTVVNYEDRILSQNESCGNDRVIERKWFVYLTGRESERMECIQRIILEDKVNPVLTGIPADITANCDNIPTASREVGAIDNCSASEAMQIDFQETITEGTCANDYTITRIWTATDACGNSQRGEQNIMVIDDAAPVLLNIPSDITVNCDNIPTASREVDAIDNCSASETIQIDFQETITEGTCANDYIITRIWTATDACGNSQRGEQKITVMDNVVPALLNIPSDITVNCDNIPTVSREVGASDNCSASETIQIDFQETITEGICANDYTITRIWTATDACGNSQRGEQKITVMDNVVPALLNIPSDITVSCENIPMASSEVRVSDNCTPNEVIQIDLLETITEGTCSGDYTIRRIWTATDACGNSQHAEQKITVEDNIAPILLNIPSDTTVSCDNVPIATNASASDNCTVKEAIQIELAETIIANICTGNYTITRIWTATDACGNQSSNEQIMTVIDTVGPTLNNIPNDVTVVCEEVPVPATVTATDNCEAIEDIEVVFKELRLNGDCEGNYLLKRAWTAIDKCGNISFAEQLITVIDTVAPVFLTCPSDTTVLAADDCRSAILALTIPEVMDNCAKDIQVASSVDLREPFPMGTTVVIFTAIDDCGNTSTCEFFVTVENAPQDNCPTNISVIAECSDNMEGAIVSWEPPMGNDCCSACPTNTDLEGFIFLGERGGHRYYYAKQPLSWVAASKLSDDLGGYLATINDPAENAFLHNFITTDPAYIGLSDQGSLGTFYWQNGEDLLYTNWAEAISSDPEETQFAQLDAAGFWQGTDGTQPQQFILELPCVEVIQLTGLMNGANFPVGTTNIQYLIDYDNCANADTCSFEVTVDSCEVAANLGQYCVSSAADTTCFWIEKVVIDKTENQSGNNGGYGDFTNLLTPLFKGLEQTLVLNPGYAIGHTFNVYWKVWIDFNQNGVFDATELIFTTKEYRPISVNFTIPASAKLGHTRLRIALNFVDENDPCSLLAFGEVEDYLVNISETNPNLILKEETKDSRSRASFHIMDTGSYPKPILGLTPMDVVAARQANFVVYPNPASSQLTVQLSTINLLLNPQQEYFLSIYNHLGQIVKQIKLPTNTLILRQIDVSSLSNGLYFIQLDLGDSQIRKHKFLKIGS